MGLFDKIKDNAKTISLKALDEAENKASDKAALDSAEHKPPHAAERKLTENPSAMDNDEIKNTDDNDDHKITVEKRLPTISSLEEQKNGADSPRLSPTGGGNTLDITPVERLKPEEPRRPRVPEPEEFDDDDGDEADDPADIRALANNGNTKTLAAMAAQLQMTGSEPIYSTSHMNFRTRVFVNRIEYMGSFGKIVIPISKVGWIKIRVAGTGIIIETTTGKRVVMIVRPKDRVRLCESIMKLQEAYLERGKNEAVRSHRSPELERLSAGIIELEKLAKLKDKGIITEKEFAAKKKEILGL